MFTLHLHLLIGALFTKFIVASHVGYISRGYEFDTFTTRDVFHTQNQKNQPGVEKPDHDLKCMSVKFLPDVH